MKLDRRRPNIWFIAAWVFLVIVTAFSQFRQDQKVQDIEDQIRVTNAVVTARLQHFSGVCLLFIKEHPEDKDKIIAAFAEGGIDCLRGIDGS